MSHHANEQLDANEQLVIVVQQRGWVKIGYIARDGDMYTLRDSRTIIRWGTTGLGLEHLAAVGPTPETKFSSDAVNGRFHVLSTIDVLSVTAAASAAWEKRWAR